MVGWQEGVQIKFLGRCQFPWEERDSDKNRRHDRPRLYNTENGLTPLIIKPPIAVSK